MITWGDLAHWDAGQVGAAGEELKADLRRLERSNDALRDRAIPGSWFGLAQLSARARRSTLVATMDRHLADAQSFLREVFRAEGRVRSIQELVVDIEHDARAQEFEIGPDGTVSDVATPPQVESRFEAEEYAASRRTLRDALVGRIEHVLTEAYDVDSTLVHARPADAFGDAAPSGVVDPEVAREWADMTEAERREVLEQMARDLAERYGLDDVDVVIEDLEDRDGDGVDDEPGLDSHGYWSDDDRSLHLDANELDDPEQIINTMAHEVRHGIQHEMVRDNDPNAWDDFWIGVGVTDDPWDPPAGITREDAERWAENFEDYQRPEDDFDAYYDQPVEVDAREAGEDYVDELTVEDLRRHREAVR